MLTLVFPLMAFASLKLPRFDVLWIAAFLGFYFDVMTTDHPFGLCAILSVITALLLYPYRRLVCEERLIPFSLYAAMFGFFYTFILSCIYTLVPPYFKWSIEFVLIDFLFLPLCDAVIGWFLFITPLFFLRFCKRYLIKWRFRHAN
jgi:hypothetical protein